jgi:opacity protein-like surface antigen
MRNVFKHSITLAVTALAMASSVQAQSSTSPSGGYSMYAPGGTYLGLNAGQSNYRLNNGVGGFASEQRKNAYSIYGGGYFNKNFGLELGYSDFDRVSRAGGSTYATAFSISLVGKLPVAPAFNLLGKLGTTYGRTDVSSNPASGIAPGKTTGWGLSYGLGAEYAFSTNWSAVLQYDEYRLKFAGTGSDKISTTSLGLRYNF